MKTFKYVNTNSPMDMTIGMFEMLSPEEALNALKQINIIANKRMLGAENFGELVYNEETSARSYTELLSCPNCLSHNIAKNGKDRNNNQRYICKGCQRTFSSSSNTLSSHTTQNTGKWMQFIIGLLNTETCETLSNKCGISVPTALYWRLKVFAAVEHLSKDIKLSGVIFADDTRIPYNFKGNHGKEFIQPRKSHSRGHQNTIKNVQRNTICVLCAIDSSDHSFSHCIGFGNPSGKRLSNGFKDKLNVDETTVLVTDGAQSFKRVVDDYSIPQWERKITVKRGGKRYPNMQGQFHIQKINSYHSRLKEFLSPFKSVASRYLPGYLLLFDYLENNKHLTKEDMAKNIIKAMTEISADITLEMLANQYKIPVSNGPEKELWELKIPKNDQKIYIDWYNKMPISKICEKHKIKQHKIYAIKNKVEKYGVHDKIMNPPRKKGNYPQRPISERNWEIFLACYRDGHTYESVGEQYGISRQRVEQIIKKVLKHPESAKVKKYYSPEDKPKKQILAFNNDEMYRDFKLIKSEDITYKDTYEVLSSMYGTSKSYAKKIVMNSRKRDSNAPFIYHWSNERKELNPKDYYDFIKQRNTKIYEDYLFYKSTLSANKIYQLLSEKYNISASRLAAIVAEVKNGYIPTFNPNRFVPNPNHERIYNSVTSVLLENPTLSKAKAIRLAAEREGFTYRTAEDYYYKFQKAMLQEQSQESVQTDEAV